MLNFQADLRQVDLRYWDLESTIDHGLVTRLSVKLVSSSCPFWQIARFRGLGDSASTKEICFLVVFNRKLTKFQYNETRRFQSEIMIL